MLNIIMQSGPPAGGNIAQVGMIVLMFLIFYFLLIRPQQQRMKKHQKMLSEIVRGDQIVTNGGLIGKVTKVAESELTVDLGDVKVKVARSMIADVRNRTEPANDAGKSKK